MLGSKTTEEPQKTTRSYNKDFSVVLDTSRILTWYEECLLDCKSVEKELLAQENNTNYRPMPRAIVFMISANSTDVLDNECVRRLSSKYEIGCTPYPNNLYRYNLTEVVEGCKKINGSFYILNWVMMKEHKFKREDNLFYENAIRIQLENEYKHWEKILSLHPESSLYFKISIHSIIPENANNRDEIFCDQTDYDFHLYYEAVINWAKMKNISLILERAFTEGHPNIGWLTMLHPKESKVTGKTAPIAYKYPSFVMRNYPIGFNNWTVDSCIE